MKQTLQGKLGLQPISREFEILTDSFSNGSDIIQFLK